MPKPRANTVRIYLRLTPEAAAALDQLAPSENKRGAYVSGLLLQQAAGAPEPAQDASEATYAAIGRQVVELVQEVARALPPG